MKQTLIVATLLLLPFSALAQDQNAIEPAEPESGFERMQRGFGMIFDGLREEVDPTVESLKGKAREMAPEMRDWVMAMGPALRDLADKIGDLNDYHAPEKLPNGDIILRRKERADDAPQSDLIAPSGPTDI